MKILATIFVLESTTWSHPPGHPCGVRRPAGCSFWRGPNPGGDDDHSARAPRNVAALR